MAWLGGAWYWSDLNSVIQLLQTWLPENPSLQFSFVGIEHPTDSRLHNTDSHQAKDLVNHFSKSSPDSSVDELCIRSRLEIRSCNCHRKLVTKVAIVSALDSVSY